MSLSRLNIQYPLWYTNINPISSFLDHLENRFLSNAKDSGQTRIDINIDLYSNNTQNSTSDSFSATLGTESVKEVQLLTELYVRAVEEVFGRTSEDSTQTKESSQKAGS